MALWHYFPIRVNSWKFQVSYCNRCTKKLDRFFLDGTKLFTWNHKDMTVSLPKIEKYQQKNISWNSSLMFMVSSFFIPWVHSILGGLKSFFHWTLPWFFFWWGSSETMYLKLFCSSKFYCKFCSNIILTIIIWLFKVICWSYNSTIFIIIIFN